MSSNPRGELVDHLFRHEAGKMVSVLTKLFGFDHLEQAEDIVQDTFIQAFETWKVKGTPDNPEAWLLRVAKNKATDYVRRRQVKNRIDSDLKSSMPVEYFITGHIEKAFQSITDSQLQMLFAICHPAIPKDAQVALALKTLGGFGIQEIANAFLTSKDTINKRLLRAKQKIREEKITIEIPLKQVINDRLEMVQKVIYLMFNEGYYSRSEESVLRKDMCLEAMRLNLLLLQNTSTSNQDSNSLMALMCFHASRFESRFNESGQLLSWKEQDQSKWNQELITKGVQYLGLSKIDELDRRYQLEATIAYFQVLPDSEEKWNGLLNLYDKLSRIVKSSMVILGLAFAISKARDPITAIQFLEQSREIQHDYLYYAMLGELWTEVNPATGIQCLNKAINLCALDAEKKVLLKKVTELKERT